MGKSKKTPKRFGQRVTMPGALSDQILSDKFAKHSKRVKSRNTSEDKSNKKFVNLSGVLAQMRDLENEVDEQHHNDREQHQQEEEEEEALLPFNVDALMKEFQQETVEGVDMSEEERIFASLMPESTATQQNFVSLVRDTLLEKHTEIQSQIDEQSVCGSSSVSPAVREMCQQAGEVLHSYRSGPIPKLVKAMPMMRNWLHMLYYTAPDQWSAAAVFQLTRVFCSQKPEMVQVFYNKVLLPRCRDDIAFYKRLNYHLYRALAKALFKPAAFFKGIILPLCMAGNCTLREAIVFGSVVARRSIPLLASAAAIIRISEMTYSGANSIFLRILFNKKYALPWKVVDAVCEHFVRFKCESRQLPVLWHQSLLTFVQRYKEDLSTDQKQALYGLAAFHSHHTITKEVRRELEQSKCREIKAAETS